MVPVSTGRDVCCVLKRPSDSRARSSVRGTHKKTVLNALLPQFSDFKSENGSLRPTAACAASPRAAAAMEEATHTSKAALWEKQWW